MQISIITVNRNNSDGLANTIESVRKQTYENIEFIVIDGASDDGSINIIKENENIITCWISEPDSGIYDAMNKGIDLAHGDFAIFLNSGDCFYAESTLFDAIKLMKEKDMAYFGRAKIASEHSSWLHPSENINKGDIEMWLEKNDPNHQAIFFPRSFYKNEKYDLNYSIFGDADYKHRVKDFSRFYFLDMIVVSFDFGGISSSFDNYRYIRVMMEEAWMGRNRRGLPHFFKRVIVYNIKYIVRLFMGEKRYLKFLRKYREGRSTV